MKVIIYIRNPEHFLKGEYFLALGVCSSDEEWAYENEQVIAEVDVDLEKLDRGDLTTAAVDGIEKRQQKILAEAEVANQELETRKGKLLALELVGAA